MRGLSALLTKGKQVKRCDTKTYGKDNSSICKIVRKKKICVHFIVSKITNVTEISGVELYQLCGRWGHHGAPPNVSTCSTVRTTPSYLGRLFFWRSFQICCPRLLGLLSLPSPVMAQKGDCRDWLRALICAVNRTAFTCYHENRVTWSVAALCHAAL